MSVLIASCSKAESATNGFIVDPGEYSPDKVLFKSGFLGSFLILDHSFLSIPYKNKFGSKVGAEFMAIISPV